MPRSFYPLQRSEGRQTIARRPHNAPPTRDTGPRVNERIRAPEIRLIGAEGENIGVITPERAMTLAVEAGSFGTIQGAVSAQAGDAESASVKKGPFGDENGRMAFDAAIWLHARALPTARGLRVGGCARGPDIAAMSITPAFLDELRNRVPVSRIVGKKVTWDLHRSNQAKGDWWAPCPFHGEKTASFHVDDQKGFYYCFGCHAKGDALTFLREAEGLNFIEAVELLASEAGLQMPERDPRQAERADRRSELVEVMEQATRWFRMQLQTGLAGADDHDLAHRRLLQDISLGMAGSCDSGPMAE